VRRRALSIKSFLRHMFRSSPEVEVAMPICEVCDRFTITRLKLERLVEGDAEPELFRNQLAYYSRGIDFTDSNMVFFIAELYVVNGQLWDVEHDIRKGLTGSVNFEVIGRQAVEVRNLNTARGEVKNRLTEYVGQAKFKDCKMNYGEKRS